MPLSPRGPPSGGPEQGPGPCVRQELGGWGGRAQCQSALPPHARPLHPGRSTLCGPSTAEVGVSGLSSPGAQSCASGHRHPCPCTGTWVRVSVQGHGQTGTSGRSTQGCRSATSAPPLGRRGKRPEKSRPPPPVHRTRLIKRNGTRSIKGNGKRTQTRQGRVSPSATPGHVRRALHSDISGQVTRPEPRAGEQAGWWGPRRGLGSRRSQPRAAPPAFAASPRPSPKDTSPCR